VTESSEEQHCGSCAGSISSTSIVCAYCGTEVPGRLSTVVAGGDIAEALNTLDNNLEALESLPHPTVGSMLYVVVYWYFHIGTYTIMTSLLGMKRPAKVSRKPFRQLTRKIQRNIDNVRDIAREDDVVSRRVERIQDALDRAVEEADKSHKTALKIAIGIPVMFIFLALLTSAFTNP
jgi:hypothetical protein